MRGEDEVGRADLSRRLRLAAEALGPIGEQVVTDAGRWGQLPVGTTVTMGANLFPRLEETAD